MKAGNLQIKWYYYGIREMQCDITKFNEDKRIHYLLGVGNAKCNTKDNFCRATGRKLTLARALKDAKLAKEERTVIWELYRNMKPNKRW